MRKLIISLKTASESLTDFARTLQEIKAKKRKMIPHYEIAFDNKRDFEKFIKNIDILMCIQSFHPRSIYELAKIVGKDQSNVNKLIIFFETLGVIKVLERKVQGRPMKKPIVDYEAIEFNLKAA